MLTPLNAAGMAAMMAIRVLLDHDVREEDIYLLSILMGRPGVLSIAYAFPKVCAVTVDHPEWQANWSP